MKKIFTIIVSFLTLLVVVPVQNSALAYPCDSFIHCITPVDPPGIKPAFLSSSGFIGTVLTAFLPAILSILGFLAVIMIVISGIQFITSNGNPEGAAAARGRLTYSIVGFILAVLAFAILQIVNQTFLGTQVVP